MKYNYFSNQFLICKNDGTKVIIIYNDFMGPYEN